MCGFQHELGWGAAAFLTVPAMVLAGLQAAVAGSGAPSLGLPVACELGRSCFIQSYVDIDPGEGVVDFACGTATYSDHDGTDFRLLSAREAAGGVPVKAAASGVVKGVRDGMPDQFVTAENRGIVARRECGNGIVLDHGDGWETQYCHMQAGSVRVSTGDRVDKGAVLGHVGYSGLAEFAHLHLTVRHNGAAIDPFTGAERTALCQREAANITGLWDEAFRADFKYRNGEILAAGFSGRVPELKATEVDGGETAPGATSPELVFYARLINLKAGDIVRLDVKGPGGFAATTAPKPLDRSKATWLAFAGKRLKASRWAPGRYEGRVEVVRAGSVLLEASRSWDLASTP